VERWNRLHPAEAEKKNYLQTTLGNAKGPIIAASDYMKSLPEMIQKWVPGGMLALGTDGFGRSDDREALRRHFEIDAECITVAALNRLMQKKEIKPVQVKQAIKDLGINPDKPDPVEA
jgi:pyruvate dehydrogenase E1 component